MKTSLQKLHRNERGNVLVLAVAALSIIIVMFGLVIDGGHLYMTKSHLQKTANAAALSGAQEIPNESAAVHKVVNEVLTSHNETSSLLDSNIEGNELHVEVGRDVPLFFASLFGQESLPVEVEAKAGLAPLAEGVGAVPLGIDESTSLVYGEKYDLKVDSGDSEAGNFGVLALEGPGAQNYEQSLTDGYQESLAIGDIIPTQTGNIAGPTRRGIEHRINNCPYPEGEYQHRDCPRVMLVIVYQPHEKSTNQLRSIKVTGFAYFYVTDRMGNNDDSISGIFIRRAGPGTTSPSTPPDRGAYAIKLTE